MPPATGGFSQVGGGAVLVTPKGEVVGSAEPTIANKPVNFSGKKSKNGGNQLNQSEEQNIAADMIERQRQFEERERAATDAIKRGQIQGGAVPKSIGPAQNIDARPQGNFFGSVLQAGKNALEFKRIGRQGLGNYVSNVFSAFDDISLAATPSSLAPTLFNTGRGTQIKDEAFIPVDFRGTEGKSPREIQLEEDLRRGITFDVGLPNEVKAKRYGERIEGKTSKQYTSDVTKFRDILQEQINKGSISFDQAQRQLDSYSTKRAGELQMSAQSEFDSGVTRLQTRRVADMLPAGTFGSRTTSGEVIQQYASLVGGAALTASPVGNIIVSSALIGGSTGKIAQAALKEDITISQRALLAGEGAALAGLGLIGVSQTLGPKGSLPRDITKERIRELENTRMEVFAVQTDEAGKKFSFVGGRDTGVAYQFVEGRIVRGSKGNFRIKEVSITTSVDDFGTGQKIGRVDYLGGVGKTQKQLPLQIKISSSEDFGAVNVKREASVTLENAQTFTGRGQIIRPGGGPLEEYSFAGIAEKKDRIISGYTFDPIKRRYTQTKVPVPNNNNPLLAVKIDQASLRGPVTTSFRILTKPSSAKRGTIVFRKARDGTLIAGLKQETQQVGNLGGAIGSIGGAASKSISSLVNSVSNQYPTIVGGTGARSLFQSQGVYERQTVQAVTNISGPKVKSLQLENPLTGFSKINTQFEYLSNRLDQTPKARAINFSGSLGSNPLNQKKPTGQVLSLGLTSPQVLMSSSLTTNKNEVVPVFPSLGKFKFGQGPPVRGGFGFPSLLGDRSNSKSFSKTKYLAGYSPSLTALFFGITGSQSYSTGSDYLGLDIRPIIIPRRKEKRRRR